jgi:hypothetical protein
LSPEFAADAHDFDPLRSRDSVQNGAHDTV